MARLFIHSRDLWRKITTEQNTIQHNAMSRTDNRITLYMMACVCRRMDDSRRIMSLTYCRMDHSCRIIQYQCCIIGLQIAECNFGRQCTPYVTGVYNTRQVAELPTSNKNYQDYLLQKSGFLNENPDSLVISEYLFQSCFACLYLLTWLYFHVGCHGNSLCTVHNQHTLH